MNTVLLITGSGPLVLLTSYASPTAPPFLEKLAAKGIDKFIAYDVPEELARERYATHFNVVEHDLKETDDLRVLDYEGNRAFRLFSFNELGKPTYYEAPKAA